MELLSERAMTMGGMKAIIGATGTWDSTITGGGGRYVESVHGTSSGIVSPKVGIAVSRVNETSSQACVHEVINE